jgi:hypothetical protein
MFKSLRERLALPTPYGQRSGGDRARKMQQ